MNTFSENLGYLPTIVIVPCFNEAARFDAKAYSSFLNSCQDVMLLFVDDGSDDDTPQLIEQLRQRHSRQICTLRMSTNVGKGEAVRRGVQIALRRRPAFVGYWDGDLATPLEMIISFRDLLCRRPATALVMGSRVSLLGRDIRRSGFRHVLGRTFATAASIILRLPVYDTQCGAKLFRVTPNVAELFAEPFASRWIFDVEILARMVTSASRHGTSILGEQTIYEYPLDRWQDIGLSRLKRKDFFFAARDLIAIYWRYMRRRSNDPVLAANASPTAASTPHRDAA